MRVASARHQPKMLSMSISGSAPAVSWYVIGYLPRLSAFSGRGAAARSAFLSNRLGHCLPGFVARFRTDDPVMCQRRAAAVQPYDVGGDDDAEGH